MPVPLLLPPNPPDECTWKYPDAGEEPFPHSPAFYGYRKVPKSFPPKKNRDFRHSYSLFSEPLPDPFRLPLFPAFPRILSPPCAQPLLPCLFLTAPALLSKSGRNLFFPALPESFFPSFEEPFPYGKPCSSLLWKAPQRFFCIPEGRKWGHSRSPLLHRVLSQSLPCIWLPFAKPFHPQKSQQWRR